MAKESGIKIEGQVIDVQRNAVFTVKLVTGHTVIGHVSGKMRQHEIRILLGDKVEMEMSPYDMSKGRIVRRK